MPRRLCVSGGGGCLCGEIKPGQAADSLAVTVHGCGQARRWRRLRHWQNGRQPRHEPGAATEQAENGHEDVKLVPELAGVQVMISPILPGRRCLGWDVAWDVAWDALRVRTVVVMKATANLNTRL